MTKLAAPVARAQEGRHWGTLVDTASIPGGGQLRLYRCGKHYEILFDEEQLMGSWAYRSEEALATLVADRLPVPAARILIGGLGMGFTLAAARFAFPAPAAIVVAELVPQVVAWARGPLSEIVGDSLTDPRVAIEVADVHDVIARDKAGYDAILLDVDNGPDGLVQLANDRLYCNWGLRSARTALRPGGVLAIWSAYPDDAFGTRLRDAGFEVEVMTLHGGGRRSDPDNVIWLATHRDVLTKPISCDRLLPLRLD